MALLRSNQIKTVFGTDKLEFIPRDGESAMIKGIYATLGTSIPNNDANSLFLKVEIQRASLGFIPIRLFGNIVNSIDGINSVNDMFKWAKMMGYNMSFPVGEGQKVVITGWDLIGNIAFTPEAIYIIYDAYDAGDIKGNEENGAFSDTLTYFNIISNSQSIDKTGSVLLDTSWLPAEFAEFPANVVPANAKIEVLSMNGQPVSVWDSTNSVGIYTKFVKLWHRRKVLFDDDKQGFPFQPSDENIGITETNALKVDADKNLFGKVFNPHLEYYGNEEMNVEVATEATGTVTIDANKIFAGLLMRISPIK